MKTQKQEPKIWNIMEHRGGWGDNIVMCDWETRRFSGHTTPLPKVGDELLIPMKTGKTGRFIFSKVEPCGDPCDMWFATLYDAGYCAE